MFLCRSGKFAGMVHAQATDIINIIGPVSKKLARVPNDVALSACILPSGIREFLAEHQAMANPNRWHPVMLADDYLRKLK